jgi:phosphohistidine phosphatase
VLKTIPADIKRVLVVGHNPGMEGLVQILSRKVVSLPTAAIAWIKLPIDAWDQLNMGVEGKLKKLWRPKD